MTEHRITLLFYDNIAKNTVGIEQKRRKYVFDKIRRSQQSL